MTKEEFNYQFEVLYNNVTSNKAPGLNTYEKSVLLTKAQDELIKDYFRVQGNSKQEGYLDSPKREYDFSTLIKVGAPIETDTGNTFHKKGILYAMPNDMFITLNEQVFVKLDASDKGRYYNIVPLTFEEYSRLIAKPFKYPPKDCVWKLSNGTYTMGNNKVPIVELITYPTNPYTFDYTIRYVKNPNPIILENLMTAYGDGITIKDKTEWQDLDTPKEMHEEILLRAVEIAKGVWLGDLESSVKIGERSE